MNPKASQFVVILIVLFQLGNLNMGDAQKETQGFDPVIVETPWGQPVVPDLPTYLGMQVYSRLKPGDPWSAGDSIRKQLSREYQSG